MLLENILSDFRHGLRLIRRAPGFAAAAIVSLAVGIGANTAMFSVVDGVLLRPLPFPDGGQLVSLWSENRRLGIARQTVGHGSIGDWRESNRTLETLAAYDPISITVSANADGAARVVSAALVSPELARVLRVAPLAGRLFTAADVTQRQPVAIMSHSAARTHEPKAGDVLGRRLEIDGRSVEIVGVLPPGIEFPDGDTDLWLPVSWARDWETAHLDRGVGPWRAIGRLAPGVSLAHAQAEFSVIGDALANAHRAENADLGIRLDHYADHMIDGQIRAALRVLLAAVAVVLLIACANVGNLLLARGLARQREFAIRLSLGATRRRLVRQLFVESSVLALLAAGLGALLAWYAVDAIRVFGPANVPRLHEIRVDAAALAFAVLVGVGSTCLFSLMPALQTTRGDPRGMLREGMRGGSEDPQGRRLRGALVIGEFALAVVLVAGAGMLVRSFVRLVAVNPGFQPDGVLVVGLRFPGHRPANEAAPYVRQVVDAVATLPGVTFAGLSEEVLLGERGEQTLELDGATPEQATLARLPLRIDAVTPDYFRVLGVALRQGRFFSSRDDSRAPAVAIVNETLARRLWPGEDPLGRHLRDDESAGTWLTVVGVVADQRRQGLDRTPIAEMFVPFAQRPSRSMNVLVRTAGDPAAVASAVRRTVQAIDRGVPVGSGTTLRSQISRTLAPRRFQTGLLTAFGGIALLLAAAGLFGLMHFSVARRTREMGIRAALGATPAQVRQMILREGLTLALAGVVVGTAAALAVLRTLAALLYGVQPTDPLSLATAVAMLLGVAGLACLLPALRASRIDPITALRTE